jgi:hypothetical protein
MLDGCGLIVKRRLIPLKNARRPRKDLGSRAGSALIGIIVRLSGPMVYVQLFALDARVHLLLSNKRPALGIRWRKSKLDALLRVTSHDLACEDIATVVRPMIDDDFALSLFGVSPKPTILTKCIIYESGNFMTLFAKAVGICAVSTDFALPFTDGVMITLRT